MSRICDPGHDALADVLSAGLCIGLVVSYLPQHLRIIYAKSSEGFSPWFLLLGSISSASGALNIFVKQWDIVKCCRVLSVGSCIEATAGIFQITLLWFLFTMILVLYIMYYPAHLKYVTVDLDSQDDHTPQHVKTDVKQEEWRLSITLAWVVFLYTLLLIFVTFLLLGLPGSEGRYTQLSLWATFLGLSSTCLAVIQYFPQIKHTYQHKLVGALSIPMMFIQTPGAVFMVLSIALRPGTNWTTWSTYAVAGILQGALLVMCIMWRIRQRKLGIDDFGNPLEAPHTPDDPLQDSPIPVTHGPTGGVPVQEAVTEAVQTDVLAEDAGEDTPLLNKNGGKDAQQSWFSWLRPQRR